MRFTIDPADGRPIYQQLVDSVTAALRDGDVAPGDRLPAAREVAASLGVNVHTVLRAYQELRDAGLMDLRRGRGAVVTRRTHEPGRTGELLATLVRTARAEGVPDHVLRSSLDAALDEALDPPLDAALRDSPHPTPDGGPR